MGADGDQLLATADLMSSDGKRMADAGVEGVDEDSIKKLKEKGKNLRNKLDEAELKKKRPPKANNLKVTIVQEDFGDDMDGVQDIKVSYLLSGTNWDALTYTDPRTQEKMRDILEQRKSEAQERAGSLLKGHCFLSFVSC